MNVKRAVLGGIVGTAVMTALMLAGPMVGLPKLAIGELLSTFLAVSVAYLPIGPLAGWAIHAAVGIALAILYAGIVIEKLPGTPAARGALYGFFIFLFAQAVFMPLVGAGLFSRGDVAMIVGSLIGHLGYGAVLGAIYDLPTQAARA
jgi:uncharacterized membrane protein YagU involved in acid resistance